MTLIEQIEYALNARYPLVYLQASEEERVMRALSQIAKKRFDFSPSMASWSCTLDNEKQDPIKVIKKLIKINYQGFFIFKDLSPFLTDPKLVRILREAYYAFLKQSQGTLFILCPDLVIPELLQKNLFVIEVIPPDKTELAKVAKQVLNEFKNVKLDKTTFNDMLLSCKGLTLDETKHTLYEILSHSKVDRNLILEQIHKSKKMQLNQADYLQYVTSPLTIEQVGGLSELKRWISKRTALFTDEVANSKIPMPKGILVMGISGCGKSLCAKVIANTWKLPLFRLDMNLVFSDAYGSAEATFAKALQTVESVAPVVLWIDEIENGLGFSQQNGNNSQDQIIAAFLTWMQEKPENVFVAATANNIEVLPAEMIRKGRFDQVFFCDLPDDEERAEIFAIHIKLYGGDMADFETKRLILSTEGWNAAEIEHLVKMAKIEAQSEDRKMTLHDIVNLSRDIIPLSKTMEKQINFIRDWAWDRAVPASKGKGLSLTL